jgi:AraC-like DNA-binding protein
MAYDDKIHESLDFIEKNLTNTIRLEELSNIVYLSKYHYHRLFHALTGDSVKRYISKRRMAEAARELATTPSRILDIALKYQFGSQEAFTRAFKRLYGMAPGEYRRLYAVGSCDHGAPRRMGRGGSNGGGPVSMAA